MPLDITIKETKKDAYLLTLTGELDTITSTELEKQVAPVLSSALGIIIDLTGLGYISSMGLRILAIIRKRVSERGGTVLLVNPQPQIQSVLDSVKILSDNLLSTLEQADELLDNFLDKLQKGQIKPRPPRE